jgi:hypothetical protein
MTMPEFEPGAILAREAAKAIRALPGVTLEDLK